MRTKCKTPSTGRTVNYTASALGTAWQTLAEAPDFSVPDNSNIFPSRDLGDPSRGIPADLNRGIRAGEIFFMTPMFAHNFSTTDCYVYVQLVEEADSLGRIRTTACPGRMLVPAGDTALVPIQGRSLLKRIATNNLGDQLQVRAERAGALDLWVTGEEKPSAEHIGVGK